MKEDKKKKLTDKQKRFCEEYIIDLNATKAAIRSGYSEKTAQQIGSENLSKPVLKEYIEELQADISKATGVTAIGIINELKKIAFANFSDFKKDWKTIEDFENLSDETKAALAEITHIETSYGEDGKRQQVKIKLHDKMKAIDALNKMLGFYATEKKDITSGGQPVKGIGIIEWVK